MTLHMKGSACCCGVVMALLLAGSLRAQPASYAGRPLADVLRDLQAAGLKIVFSSELVRPDARVLAEPRSKTPRRLLDEVLRPHGLEVRPGPGNTLLVVRAARPPSKREAERPAAAPSGSITGRVVDARSGSPIAGVTVQVQDSGHSAQTDRDGGFALSGVPVGRHALFVSTIGYSLARPDIEVVAGAVATITGPLAEGTGAYTEHVTVTADALPVPDRENPAQQTLTSAGLQNVRAVLVDDPLRAVQVLPGVAANDDFRSDFSVRGADFHHVGLSIDGVNTPFLLHDFAEIGDAGSMSIINSDILDRVTLALGSHPQRYGDRTGAWLDVSMREGSRAATGVRAAVSGTNASFLGEGPIGRQARGSWLVSVRRSYIDWLVRRVVPKFDAIFGFTDVESKIVYDLTPRQQLQLTAIAGRSRLTQENETFPDVVVAAADDLVISGLGLRSTIGQSMIVTQRASVVGRRFRNTNPFGVAIGRGDARDLSYRADAAWMPRGAVTLEFGGQRQQLSESRTLDEYGLTQTGTPVLFHTNAFDAPADVTSAYVHSVIGGGRWSVASGARVSGSSLTSGTVVSPWLQGTLSLTPSFTLRGGAGVYHQFPEFTQAFGSHAGVNLRPERARDVEVSLEHRLDASTHWQVTLYHRQDDDVLSVRDDYRVANGTIVVPSLDAPYENALTGSSRGVELFVRRQSARHLSGWLSYTWGHRTDRDTLTGERFDGDVDQRHAVNLWAQYPLSSHSTISAKMRYGSNFPLAGYFEQRSGGLFLGEQRNQVRLPAYARLDFRVNHVFNYTKRRLTLFVEVMNVLDRANVRPVNPALIFRTGRITDYTQDLFPRLPSAGLLFEF